MILSWYHHKNVVDPYLNPFFMIVSENGKKFL